MVSPGLWLCAPRAEEKNRASVYRGCERKSERGMFSGRVERERRDLCARNRAPAHDIPGNEASCRKSQPRCTHRQKREKAGGFGCVENNERHRGVKAPADERKGMGGKRRERKRAKESTGRMIFYVRRFSMASFAVRENNGVELSMGIVSFRESS